MKDETTALEDGPGNATGVHRRELLAGGVSLAAVTAAASFAGPAASSDAPAPNILYIMVDDLGWKDVGFHGSDIQTPHIDQLAKAGAELSDFYVQPMCTPTRAALMTGRYPFRYGLQTGVIPSGASYGLALDEYLLPQALKSVGYDTALIGKWHLGHAKSEYWPRQRGFDYAYGPLIGEIDHFTHRSHGVIDWYRDNRQVDEPGYDTDLFGADAVKLIEERDGSKPLFLYLAFTAPHSPYQAPQAWLDRYPGIADPSRKAYAAMTSAMDDQIGKVVAALEKKGMRQNTLIVFHSDNGGTRSKMFVGEGAVAGDLPPNNDPYRDGKGTLYEGGTRVVAFANWPGRIKPGAVEGMMHVTDMLPTFAALAGASTGKCKPLDGLNVWPALSGGASPRHEVVYNVEPMQAAVRQDNWKLHWLALLPPKVELFDLAKDPSETTNLAEQNPEKTAALQKRVVELAKVMAPPLFFGAALKSTLSEGPSTEVYALGEFED